LSDASKPTRLRKRSRERRDSQSATATVHAFLSGHRFDGMGAAACWKTGARITADRPAAVAPREGLSIVLKKCGADRGTGRRPAMVPDLEKPPDVP
jgi:hypothetical protein